MLLYGDVFDLVTGDRKLPEELSESTTDDHMLRWFSLLKFLCIVFMIHQKDTKGFVLGNYGFEARFIDVK